MSSYFIRASLVPVKFLKCLHILKMKFCLSLLIAVALAAVVNSAVVQRSVRANLSVGYISAGDRLLQRQYLYQPARPNTIQYQDFTYQGNFSTRISAVTATEIGQTQYATAWILRGGVGFNTVTVRVQSARGYGYYYAIDVWGR